MLESHESLLHNPTLREALVHTGRRLRLTGAAVSAMPSGAPLLLAPRFVLLIERGSSADAAFMRQALAESEAECVAAATNAAANAATNAAANAAVAPLAGRIASIEADVRDQHGARHACCLLIEVPAEADSGGAVSKGPVAGFTLFLRNATAALASMLHVGARVCVCGVQRGARDTHGDSAPPSATFDFVESSLLLLEREAARDRGSEAKGGGAVEGADSGRARAEVALGRLSRAPRLVSGTSSEVATAGVATAAIEASEVATARLEAPGVAAAASGSWLSLELTNDDGPLELWLQCGAEGTRCAQRLLRHARPPLALHPNAPKARKLPCISPRRQSARRGGKAQGQSARLECPPHASELPLGVGASAMPCICVVCSAHHQRPIHPPRLPFSLTPGRAARATTSSPMAFTSSQLKGCQRPKRAFSRRRRGGSWGRCCVPTPLQTSTT